MLKHRLAKLAILLLFNGVVITLLLYGFEQYLAYTDPFAKLPFDSYYYKNNQIYYPYLIPLTLPVGAERFSWGQVITTNEFGLRERPFNQPKAADVCRIMVLGDSFTFGIGLSWEERFTYLVETQLNQTFPQQKFEVINMGRSGAPTVSEVLEAQSMADLLTPDLLVIAFVTNDPQPKSQNYRREKELFDKQYGPTIQTVIKTLAQVGLPQTAQTTQEALDNMLVSAGVFPSWEVGLQRTYEPDSVEWQNFEQALHNLKDLSTDLGLPTPIFMVLNQNNYVMSNQTVPIYLRWTRQSEQTAAEIGLRHYNYEDELATLSPDEIPLNILDAHPSARVNQLYAQKLFTQLAADFKAGDLCAHPNGAKPVTPAPLAPKRLLSVKLGANLRFLGYVITQTEPLQLNFGWQALGQIATNYRIKLQLVDKRDKVWLEQETLPCQGKCPTPLWPPQLIAPPGAKIIYRPEKEVMTPVSQGVLHDTHELSLPPNLPPGTYTLTLSLLDQATPLPIYDELGQRELSQVILGTIKQ